MDEIRENILELCSESEHGSWEFWLKNPEDRTMEDAEQIMQGLVDLVKDNKIYAMEYVSVKDKTYKRIELDMDRLRKEVVSSINPDNIGSTNSYYWFLATEEGKREDLLLRAKNK